MSRQIIELRAGDLHLAVSPNLGGAVTRFDCKKGAIFRPTSQQVIDAGWAVDTSSYVLVPYCNRIRVGRFSWAGVDYQVPLVDFDSNALHGVGWIREWAVRQKTLTTLHLALQHRPDIDWPFAFDTEQRFELAEDALTYTVSVTNRHMADAPFGLGWHPFFAAGTETTVRFPATHLVEVDQTFLPTHRVPLTPQKDCNTPRRVFDVCWDNCFDGGNAAFELHHPGWDVRVTTTPAQPRLQVYRPEGVPWIAIEPVTHAVDAINLPDPKQGDLWVLAPGETRSLTVRVEVESYA